MRVKEYETYIADLLQHDDVQKLHEAQRHHFRRSRLEHSYAVGKLSFRLARIVHGNVSVAARAGFLHDWYHDLHPHFKRFRNPDMHHFRQSVEAAEKYGESPEVIQAIRTHMWPYGRKAPRTREAWIVWMADNLVWVADWWISVKRNWPAHKPQTVEGHQ